MQGPNLSQLLQTHFAVAAGSKGMTPRQAIEEAPIIIFAELHGRPHHRAAIRHMVHAIIASRGGGRSRIRLLYESTAQCRAIQLNDTKGVRARCWDIALSGVTKSIYWLLLDLAQHEIKLLQHQSRDEAIDVCVHIHRRVRTFLLDLDKGDLQRESKRSVEEFHRHLQQWIECARAQTDIGIREGLRLCMMLHKEIRSALRSNLSAVWEERNWEFRSCILSSRRIQDQCTLAIAGASHCVWLAKEDDEGEWQTSGKACVEQLVEALAGERFIILVPKDEYNKEEIQLDRPMQSIGVLRKGQKLRVEYGDEDPVVRLQRECQRLIDAQEESLTTTEIVRLSQSVMDQLRMRFGNEE